MSRFAHKYPLSLFWVESFANSLVPMDLFGWDLLETADPLKWILHLRFKSNMTDEQFRLVRSYLDAWCNVNDCVYKRSHWKKTDIKAKLLVKGLGPKQNTNPFF